MRAFFDIFRGRSGGALLKAWAAVLGPFLFCFLVHIPMLPEIPEVGLAGPYMVSGLVMGLVFSVLFFVVLGLPPLYRLRARGQTGMGDYLRVPVIWTALVSAGLATAAMIAVLAGDGAAWRESFFATLLVFFTLMVVPVMLGALAYWFLAIRTAGGERAVTVFSVIFVIWNIYCFIIANGYAGLMVD